MKFLSLRLLTAGADVIDVIFNFLNNIVLVVVCLLICGQVFFYYKFNNCFKVHKKFISMLLKKL